MTTKWVVGVGGGSWRVEGVDDGVGGGIWREWTDGVGGDVDGVDGGSDSEAGLDNSSPSI